MTLKPFTITIYYNTVTDDVVDETVALYREIYAEPPYLEGEQDFTNFAQDLPDRSKQTGFRLALARLGSETVGFALGHELNPGTSWWDGSTIALPSSVTKEHPGRTFAVIELAVRREQRRRGLGRRLHAHLLTDLETERATLLVRPDAEPALAAYRQWGYRDIGRIQPFPKGAIYNAMVLIQKR